MGWAKGGGGTTGDSLKVDASGGGITTSLAAIEDQDGTDSVLKVSTTDAAIASNTGQLKFGASSDVGLVRQSAGYLKATNGTTGMGQMLATSYTASVDATGYASVGTTTGLALNKDVPITWCDGATLAGTKDVGFARAAAGVVKVTDGNTGVGQLRIATANGATGTFGSISELVTVVAGNTSTSATHLLPANSLLLAVGYFVQTAINAAGTWSLGDGTTADKFGSAIAVAAGTTATVLSQWNPANANVYGPVQATDQHLVMTFAGGDPADANGRVRFTVYFLTFGAPTS